MSGIYLHIPFCKKACHYCNFHFSTSLKNKSAVLNALKQELMLRSDYLAADPLIKSVYWGGGTPSLLTIDEILDLWKVIEQHYSLADDLEITLEANPDDLTLAQLMALKRYTPINRLSIGVQSFFEEDLRYMNRAHNSSDAKDSIANALKAGFSNLSVDLIYGTPTMSDEQWLENIRTAFSFEVPHLSCYALTVEPKTALQHMIVKGKSAAVSEEQTARQFELLLQEISAEGYEQYEISNFCRPPHYARHNSAYWKGAHYLGVGPSAHSFNGHSRQWNIPNNALYTKGLEKKELNFELEELSEKEQYNEYVLTSLRTKWGLDIDHIYQQWGTAAGHRLVAKLQPLLQNAHMLQSKNNYTLSDAGKLLADHIISDLFWD